MVDGEVEFGVEDSAAAFRGLGEGEEGVDVLDQRYGVLVRFEKG